MLKFISSSISSILEWKWWIIPLKFNLLALVIAFTVYWGIYKFLSSIFIYELACKRSRFNDYNFFWISLYFDVSFLIYAYFSRKYAFIYKISPSLTYSNYFITSYLKIVRCLVYYSVLSDFKKEFRLVSLYSSELVYLNFYEVFLIQVFMDYIYV